MPMDTLLINAGEVGTPGDAPRQSQTGAGARRRSPASTPQIHEMIAKVENAVAEIADSTDPEIARLRSQVERVLTSARESIADGTDQIRRRASRAISESDRYVRDRPWQAIGIAAAAGLAAGFLLARR